MMRQIGTLDNELDARVFTDYLLTRGVKGRVEAEDGRWAVWIFEEDEVEQAREELSRFVEDAGNPLYRQAAGTAQALRKEEEKLNRQARRQYVDVRKHWERPLARRAPVTTALIVISIVVTGLTSTFQDIFHLGDREGPIKQALTIVSYEKSGSTIRWQSLRSPENSLRKGELWRLITPIFLHLDLMHIAFNMLALRYLGGTVELRRGSLRLCLMVLFFAAAPNLAQYLADHPAFGGMSGVVFGLFGYAWMKSRFDPQSGLYIPPQTVIFVMLFYVICFTGLVGSIANVAHTVGLFLGAATGYVSSMWRRSRRAE